MPAALAMHSGLGWQLVSSYYTSVSLVQTDSGARATWKRNFFRGLASSVVLIQIADVKTPAGNGHGRSDFFPLTHWSVVVAAGESQAEPEIAQKAFAELCQTYWAPLCSFVHRGYAMEIRKISQRA